MNPLPLVAPDSSQAHTLMGRSADEVVWFKRRSLLQAASSWVALGGWQAAVAQQRSNIVAMQGDVLLNRQRLTAGQTVQTGDNIYTGPDSTLVFVIGNAAFQVRQNTRLTVERGSTLSVVSVLRLFSGAVASVWGKGRERQIVTPTLTAGIRGTGVYTEVWPEQGYRSYFCNCYGTVDLAAGSSQARSQALYHQSFWAEPEPVNGRYLTAAKAINHTDEEIDFLAALAQERTAWQLAGQKGNRDGSGKMDGKPYGS